MRIQKECGSYLNNEKAHAENNGSKCPFCESIDLEFISSLESVNNDTLVSALTECLSCFKTWETLFKFAGNNYETQEEASR
ncbi:MAG: hypothetical protein HOG45_07815 [Deltaproteobacteria bacterium]|jgi:hypothetical protein|nr:hypothetical protein [Deltaproteobacteria bacterium]